MHRLKPVVKRIMSHTLPFSEVLSLQLPFHALQVLADRWLQQGDYGPARTTTAGGVRTNVTTATAAGAVNPSSHGVPSSSSSNVPGGGDAGGNTAGIPRNGNNISSHSGPVNGGGGGVGLGLRPPPSLSFLPLTEQGYRAIKVSDDEVHKSINEGITTGGNPGPGSAVGGGSSPLKQQRYFCWYFGAGCFRRTMSEEAHLGSSCF